MLTSLMESVASLAEAPARSRVPALATAPAGGGVDGTTVESAVRKAISDSRQDESKRAAPAPPTEANIKAQCSQILEHAIGAKRWTEADAEAWRQNIGQLTAEHTDELLAKLSMSINQGRLIVETEGRIF